MRMPRYRISAALVVCSGTALLASTGWAQTPPPGNPATPPEVMEPPSENETPPADPSTGSKPKEPLSKALREGEGVLEPPKGVDPGIQKGVPDDFKGKTPVIPPPGEPGGNSDVQPK